MTGADRALLELAAKAAGIALRWGANGQVAWLFTGADDDDDDPTPWNPLVDDGDALRLAVRLKLGLQLREDECVVYLPGSGGCAERATLRCGIDAATRRAIVRAAAMLGKAMP